MEVIEKEKIINKINEAEMYFGHEVIYIIDNIPSAFMDEKKIPAWDELQARVKDAERNAYNNYIDTDKSTVYGEYMAYRNVLEMMKNILKR